MKQLGLILLSDLIDPFLLFAIIGADHVIDLFSDFQPIFILVEVVYQVLVDRLNLYPELVIVLALLVQTDIPFGLSPFVLCSRRKQRVATFFEWRQLSRPNVYLHHLAFIIFVLDCYYLIDRLFHLR